MSAIRFFSAKDLRDARRWKPGTISSEAPSVSPPPPPPQPEEPVAPVASDVRARAREDGFRDGFSAGQAAATAHAERLAAISESARRCLADIEQEMAEGILLLALDVARQIIRTELRVCPEDILPVIREAMECLSQSAPNPQLFLHPDDVHLVRAHIGDEISVRGWRIVEDHRIEPGGCRISSPICEVDATLATRWKRVVASIGQDLTWAESGAAT